jgi:lipopolysaccharide/colanic/teichoic acid biosynthesis glycosyltransferase
MERPLKRLVDICGAAAGLVLLLPVLAIAALTIRLAMGRPVLFRQTRPGLEAKPFTLLKFRTMREARDESGRSLPDTLRITRLGRFLRSTSLDELPELWNVLRGEMSLVGPRPLLMDYLGRYDRQQWRRMDVKPGITGWAQIHGRNLSTWEERFAHDLWYVDNHNLWVDLTILWRTVVLVVRRQGIHAEGHATMPEFAPETGADR